jgi:hypothetical protein
VSAPPHRRCSVGSMPTAAHGLPRSSPAGATVLQDAVIVLQDCLDWKTMCRIGRPCDCLDWKTMCRIGRPILGLEDHVEDRLPRSSPPGATVLQDAVIVLQDCFSFAGLGAMLASRYDRKGDFTMAVLSFAMSSCSNLLRNGCCALQNKRTLVFSDDATKQSNGLSCWAISMLADCVRPEHTTHGLDP